MIAMSSEQYGVFIVVTTLFMMAPGPSVMLAISHGLKYGTRRSLMGVLGNVVASQSLIVLSSIGVGAVLMASGELFRVVKIIGALYLLYLGVKLWFSSGGKAEVTAAVSLREGSAIAIFQRGFLVTALNPKALVYVSALLPQFIDATQSLMPQVVGLSLTYAGVQTMVFGGYALLASRARGWFSRPAKLLLFNRMAGITFISFGVMLALSENKSS